MKPSGGILREIFVVGLADYFLPWQPDPSNPLFVSHIIRPLQYAGNKPGSILKY